jgi:predicted permease
VPVGFFVVGVTLARERRRDDVRPPRPAAVATGVALKLLVAPAIVLGLSVVLIDVPPAYLTQAAMASGVNNLLIANAYGLDRGLVSAGIAWSTVAVLAVGLVAELVA